MPSLCTIKQKIWQHIAEIRDLERVASLAYWDMQTYMPGGGAESRGEQLASLSRFIHRQWADPYLGNLIETLQSQIAKDDTEWGATLFWALREHDQARKVPENLVAEQSLVASQGYRHWMEARQHQDYRRFLPTLHRVFEVSRETAWHLDSAGDPLQTLLDVKEPGFKIDEIQEAFRVLAESLQTLLKHIQQSASLVSDAALRQRFDPKLQWDLGLCAAQHIGFDWSYNGRQDISVHPFTASISSPHDVRITTRMDAGFFSQAFFATLHEAGHGIYEQGLQPHWNRSILGQASSNGMHESQSRLWENVVGRSPSFWRSFFPQVRAHFPEQTESLDWEDFYRAVNCVTPSLIRVEADEVTYNLHAIIRFELERDVFAGSLDIDDLPEAWDEKYVDYLGCRPVSPTEGMLQDIHWSSDFGASFVSYTLGNLMSVQLFEAATQQDTTIMDSLRHGEYAPLRQWMETHVYAKGRLLLPKQLLRQATGGPLQVQPFINYLTHKYESLYTP